MIRRCCAPIPGAAFGIAHEMSIAALRYRCNGSVSFRHRSGILAETDRARPTRTIRVLPRCPTRLPVFSGGNVAFEPSPSDPYELLRCQYIGQRPDLKLPILF
jgi:hypothetical protein